MPTGSSLSCSRRNGLEIGHPDDPLEHEAERIADRVMAMQIPRNAGALDYGQAGERPAPRAPAAIQPAAPPPGAADAPGRPLDSAARGFLEPRFGRSFADIRISDDGPAARGAASVSARAYTVGRSIVFGAGQYQPHERAGMRLLAHELGHVVQHGEGRVPAGRVMRQPAPGKHSIVDLVPGNDWRLLGAQPGEVSDDDLRMYLVRFANLDKATVDQCTIVNDAAPGQEPNRVFRHPSKGALARILIRHSAAGSASVFSYVFMFAPNQADQGARPGTPSGPQPSPGQPTPQQTTKPQTPAAAPPGSQPGSDLKPISIPELQSRLRLIEAATNRVAISYQVDPNRPEAKLVQAARDNLQAARNALTGSAIDVERITEAEAIIERIEHAVMVIHAKLLELAAQSDVGASRDAYNDALASVGLAYFQALAKLLTADQAMAFNDAEAKAVGLPRALIEVDLKRFESPKPKYELMEPTRKEIADWVQKVRPQLDEVEKLSTGLKAAREANGANVPTLEKDLLAKAELVQLSIEAIGHWDRVRQAYEYLADGNNLIWTAYRSISHLVGRCRTMKELAAAGKLAELRATILDYRDDDDIAAFYQGLPVIVAGSRFLVSLGIALVAALVTAGVGSLVAGGLAGGAAVGGGAAAATATTAQTALAFAGTVALEAITFTAVTTGLNYAVLGQKPTPGGIGRDLLWNLGTFGLLKGVSIGILKGMTAAGLPGATGIATGAVTLPLLHGIGLLRFRLEQGRWMTQSEVQTASAEFIVMAAGLAVGTAAMKRWIGENKSATELAKFERDYGFRFSEIEAGRQRLIDEVADLIGKNRGDDKAAMDDIRDRAGKLEDIARDVVKEIASKVDLTKLRAELDAAGRAFVQAGSAEALAKVVGVDVDTGLRRGGGERTFTYAWGKTKQLEGRLRALDGTVNKTTDAATGLRTMSVVFGEEDPVTFQERPDPVFGEIEVEFNPADPLIAQFVADLKLTDPVAIRALITMVTAELARSSKQTLTSAIGQVRATLRTRTKVSPGVEYQDLVLATRAKGIVASGASPALVAEATRLVAGGLLDDPAWTERRTLADFLGLLGERLGLGVVAAPTSPGGRVLSNVTFIGDKFTDPAGTVPQTTGGGKPVVNTTVTELDFMGVSGIGPDVVVESLTNVKAGTGQGGAASGQNQNAESALRGHISGNLAPLKDGSSTVYARVRTVTGVNAAGVTVDLTGTLKDAPGGIHKETIGPKAARGYDRQLPYNEKDLKTLVELLREMQMKRSPDY